MMRDKLRSFGCVPIIRQTMWQIICPSMTVSRQASGRSLVDCNKCAASEVQDKKSFVRMSVPGGVCLPYKYEDQLLTSSNTGFLLMALVVILLVSVLKHIFPCLQTNLFSSFQSWNHFRLAMPSKPDSQPIWLTG